MSQFAAGLSIVLALFFAANIGASGTAAAMGEPYGGGALRRARTALLLVAVFAFLGAAVGGGKVAQTIGVGLIDPDVVRPELVLVILSAACLTLFTANLIGIPLSTSEVTVGAVVGVGLAAGGLLTQRLPLIFLAWIVVPIWTFAITVAARRYVIPYVEAWLATFKNRHRVRQIIGFVLVATGCYQAFAAGMNNVANAVGPLLSAELVPLTTGLLMGGAGLSAGALFLGRRVLETNAKRITRLSLLDATAVAFTGGTLVLLASLWGIPVPLTQTTTVGIMGIGVAKRCETALNRPQVIQILRVWILSPIASLLLALGLTHVATGASTWSQVGTATLWIATSFALLALQANGPLRSSRRAPAKQ